MVHHKPTIIADVFIYKRFNVFCLWWHGLPKQNVRFSHKFILTAGMYGYIEE